MTANELAEIIQHLENAKYMGASKAAAMLRQQEVEIERITSKYEEMLTVKELTDEEIHDLIVNKVTDYDMIKQALKKAQEK